MIATPLRRILAFLLDSLFFVCFFRFTLLPLFIAKQWDIYFDFKNTIVIPSIVGIILFLFKDSLYGVSIGKFFLSIRIKKVQKKNLAPSFFALFMRNIPLLLCPLELFFLLYNKYARRFGDHLAGSFVLTLQDKEYQKNPVRWFSKKVIFFIFLISFLVSGYFIVSPLQVKKSYAFEISTQKLENDRHVLQQFGKIRKYSYWNEFYYDQQQKLHLNYKFYGQYFSGRVNFILEFDQDNYYLIKKMEIFKK